MLHWLAYKSDYVDTMMMTMSKNGIMNSKKYEWLLGRIESIFWYWCYYYKLCWYAFRVYERTNIELRLISKALLRWIEMTIHSYNDHYIHMHNF